MCDEHEVPALGGGVLRVDLLGHSMVVLRVPREHPFGDEVKEGEPVVLGEESLNGVDPLLDLFAAADPTRNPTVKRWITKEINRMVRRRTRLRSQAREEM